MLGAAATGTVTSQVTVTLPPATQTPEPSATPTVVYTPTPDKEIITNPSGIGFELGAKIEGQQEGVREVIDIVPAETMDAKKQADFEIRTNPETYGFKEGETILAYVPNADGSFTFELRRATNFDDVIAVFGTTGFTWNPAQLKDDNGNPTAMRVGKIIAMNGSVPVDKHNADSAVLSPLLNDFLKLTKFTSGGTSVYTFISKDGTEGVQFLFSQKKIGDKGEGYVYFRGVKGEIIYMYVVGFDGNIGFVKGLPGWK